MIVCKWHLYTMLTSFKLVSATVASLLLEVEDQKLLI